MRKRRGAWLGLASAAAALGVAHLVSGLIGRAEASPIVAVGSAAIDRVPRWLKEFAIGTFGIADKLVLVLVMAAVVSAVAIAVGIASLRRPEVGYASLVLLATIGVLAALTRPNAESIDALRVGGRSRRSDHVAAPVRELVGAGEPAGAATVANPDQVSRRRFLLEAAALGAALAGVAGQFVAAPEAVASCFGSRCPPRSRRRRQCRAEPTSVSTG